MRRSVSAGLPVAANAAAIVALLLGAGTARAQATAMTAPPTAGYAAIAGVVDDSLHGGPLAGATVSILGTALHTTTDPSGLFRLDSIPPGDVQIRVRHPLLDTLLISITTNKVTVVAGRLDQVALATPSLGSWRDRVCPRGGIRAGDGVITGRVDDADSGVPLASAVVSLVYSDPDPTGKLNSRVRTARADADGRYVICGLPETLEGNIQAAHGRSASAEVPVSTHANPLATASFLLGTAVRADSVETGSAVLTGRVTDVTGRPIQDAQVAVEGGSGIARTAQDGTFTLNNLPSGTTNASVRKIGFAQTLRTVHLRKAEPETMNVALAAGTRSLAPVKITAKAEEALDRVGFTERLKMGNRSNFMFPDDVDKRQTARLSDVFRTMPGFIVTMQGNDQVVQSSRSVNGGQTGCVNIFVDRVKFEQISPGDLDQAFPMYTIGAIESYPSAATTPADFRTAGAACATIIIWTKMRINR